MQAGSTRPGMTIACHPAGQTSTTGGGAAPQAQRHNSADLVYDQGPSRFTGMVSEITQRVVSSLI